MTFRTARLVLLAAGLAGIAAAVEPLTLERAIELAEANHPQLRAARAQIEGSQYGITTARAYPNPETGVLAGHQAARLAGTVPGAIQVYNFSQPLETPSVRSTRILAAEIRLASSELVLQEVRLNVRAAVRQAFYQVLRRKSEIGIAQENHRLVEELRRRIQVQFEVGEAAKLEITRAEAEVAIAGIAVQSAQMRLATAVAGLRAAVNLPAGTEIDAVGTLDPDRAVPEIETLRNEVLSAHPGIRLAESEVRRADMRLRYERAQRTPQPWLRSEYEHQPEVATWRVGISVPVPVWNKREGPVGEAFAAVRQTQSEAEFRRLELNALLESAYGRYKVASRQVAVYQEGVLRQAEAALEAADAAYRFGERGILELLDAQRVLRAARLDFINAQYDRQAALIEIEQLRAADFRENTSKP